MWYVATFTGEDFREEMDFAGETEEQAKERQNDQDNIGDDRAGVAGFCFLVSHFTAPLFLAWRLV